MHTSKILSTLAVSTLFACLGLGLTGASFSPPGSLDTTFGSNGIVETGFPGVDCNLYALAIQPDGKIVAGGSTSDNQATLDFALARYDSNGSLDTTFGTDGQVVTDFFGNPDTGAAVLLQPDGKILLAGSAIYISYGDRDFALVRYNQDGSLDTTFGTDGQVTTDFDDGDDLGKAVLLQSDGKIVVVGWAAVGANYNFALARYDIHGNLDATFGSNGKVITHFGDRESLANAAVLQPDGKILVAGDAYDSADRDTRLDEFALARYTTDGHLDPTFGDGGIVTSNFGDDDHNFATSIALQPDGKIVAGGSTYLYGDDIAVARYTSSGSLDAIFGSAGRTIVRFEHSSSVTAMALQADGKIVVIGGTFGSNDRKVFAMARLQTDGSLDTLFGNNGLVTTPIPYYDGDPYAIALQTDGKIVLGGNSSDAGTHPHFALARYNAADWMAFLPLAMK